MLKMIVNKLVKKHGFKNLLIKIGDLAVKITKSKKDDKAWAEIKKVLDTL
jgi:hypothetical protein